MDASAPLLDLELSEDPGMAAPAVAPHMELPDYPRMASPGLAADGERSLPVSGAMRQRIVDDK